jgi:hypothetical protein
VDARFPAPADLDVDLAVEISTSLIARLASSAWFGHLARNRFRSPAASVPRSPNRSHCSPTRYLQELHFPSLATSTISPATASSAPPPRCSTPWPPPSLHPFSFPWYHPAPVWRLYPSTSAVWTRRTVPQAEAYPFVADRDPARTWPGPGPAPAPGPGPGPRPWGPGPRPWGPGPCR